MNKVILMGRLTKDPEVRYSQSETPIAIVNYRIAVRSNYSRNSDRGTEFINVVAFGKDGEFAAKYFKKGNMIIVEGRIHEDNWEDAEHMRHSRFEIVVENQHFAGNKVAGEISAHNEAIENEVATTHVVESKLLDDDLPY